MSIGTRLGVVGALAFVAVGCGGAKLDREGAARIAAGAGNTSNSAKTKGGLLSLMQSGDFQAAVTVSCSKGGTAKMSASGVDLSGGISLAFDMEFDDCTEPMWDDPETEQIEQEEVSQDGTFTLTFEGSGTCISSRMKGRLDLSGAVRDSVEMDLTQKMCFSLTDTSAEFTSTMNGSIKTSDGTHTYSNETWRLNTSTGEFVKDGEA